MLIDMTRDEIMARTFRSSDIETDGFDATKVHVMSVTDLKEVTKPTRSFSTWDYDRMRDLMAEDVTWIFHNGHSFDKPMLEKLLGVEMKGDLIDTLAVSWYLYPMLNRHGLAWWGEELGIAKPEIDDWVNLSLEEYVNRCEEDVRIQTKLWQQMWKHLILLYGDEVGAMRAVKHVSFKLEIAAIQQKARWKLNVEAAQALLDELTLKYEAAVVDLEAALPPVPVYVNKTRPKKCYKANGDMSALGIKWYELCEEYGEDPESGVTIKKLQKYKDPNAASPKQIKDWLYSMGWVPETFDYKRDKETNDVRKIPQIKNKDTGELCPSVARLIEQEQSVEHLGDIAVVKHRMSVVKGLLNNVDSKGYVIAAVQGFTNTLRFKHKICVNLPSVRKPYGQEIRSLLTARDERFELCGSDMASLEDRTKQHYMWKFDPDYVRDMMTAGFDPHLDMAKAADMVSQADIDFYKGFDTHADNSAGDKERYARIALVRHAGKGTNYAATYGAGGATIARSAGVSESIGDKLHAAYWARNWALKAIADECEVKLSRKMKWLWNPVAKLWYFLKADKDRFSTLNQGTGTYAFDMWVMAIMSRYRHINAQFHDEVVIEIPVGNQEKMTKILKDSVADVNADLKLNRELDCDIDFGRTYADIH